MPEPDLSRAEWQRATADTGEESNVEIAVIDGQDSPADHKSGEEKLILMRDAKHPEGPVLVFTPAEWEAFVGGVKDGEFDLDTFPVPEDLDDVDDTDDPASR